MKDSVCVCVRACVCVHAHECLSASCLVKQGGPHLGLRCWEYLELSHDLNQSHLGLHESQTHSDTLPWSTSKGNVCTGVVSGSLGLVKPASVTHRGAAVTNSSLRDTITSAAVLPVRIESIWFGPEILPVVHPVYRANHKRPSLDGNTIHSAVLVASAYNPA